MKSRIRSEIELRLNDSLNPVSAEYRVLCFPLLHRLGVDVTFRMMQPYLDPNNRALPSRCSPLVLHN